MGERDSINRSRSRIGRKKAPCAAPPGAVTAEEAARFAAAAAEVVHLPAAQAQGYAGIGTLREKRLHMAVKRYLSPDATGQEVPVRELGEAGTARDRIADVRLPDGHIFEVQTGGFYPLRRKIGLYMAHTDSPVTVVHPLPYRKYLSWIDPASGQILSAGYARLTGIRGRTTYGILHLLEKLELIREDGMEGRSRRYRLEAKSDG